MNKEISTIYELQKQILKVFPRVAPPLPNYITQDLYGDSSKVRNNFESINWWEAGSELIDDHFDCLPLFTDEAYHYYLPAFILRSLNNFNTSNKTLEFTVYSLSPTKTSKSDPWFSARLQKFTADQKAVIRSFLTCILQNQEMYSLYNDAERALNKFWS